MFITLRPGDIVCDYATPKDLNVIKAQGYKGVARYLWDGWKGMTATELRALYAAGFCVWGIYESTRDRALAGAAAGTADGRHARQLADRIGFKGGIIWVLDVDSNAQTAPAVIAYGRAFAAAVNAPQVGAYIDGDVCELMSSPHEFNPVWRPGAGWWSRFWTFGKWKNTHPYTHITQLTGIVPGTDHGVVLRQTEGWRELTAVVSVPSAPTVPTPTLRLGHIGARVKELQHALKFWGHYTGPVDGIFGPFTRAAVKRLQEFLKAYIDDEVYVDGVYGPQTAGAYREFLMILAALQAKK